MYRSQDMLEANVYSTSLCPTLQRMSDLCCSINTTGTNERHTSDWIAAPCRSTIVPAGAAPAIFSNSSNEPLKRQMPFMIGLATAARSSLDLVTTGETWVLVSPHTVPCIDDFMGAEFANFTASPEAWNFTCTSLPVATDSSRLHCVNCTWSQFIADNFGEETDVGLVTE